MNRTILKSLVMAVGVLLSLHANAETINGITYILSSSSKTATVTSGNYSGAIDIPASVTYNGETYTVTSIADHAFWGGNYKLTSVSIPNTVTSIKDHAFYQCFGLTTISIPGSVSYIGESAFESCALVSVEIEDGVKYIHQGAFRYCRKLESIAIPNSVQSIGIEAFSGCYALASVSISNNVTSINSGTFQNCVKLESVAIPNSVTSIGFQSFLNCTNLKTIIIPNSVTTIDGSFDGCSSLNSITIPNSVTSIGSATFRGCDLTTVEIPNSVKSIGAWAFANNSGLASVIIPNSVTSISKQAFEGCSALTSVVSEIEVPFTFGSSAFDGISSSCILTVPIGTVDAYTSAGWTSSVFKGGVKEVGGKIAQSLTLASLPNMTYGATSYTLPTKTTEGLTLTWTSNNSQVATISGNVLSVKGAGSVVITASQLGNDTYQAFAKDYTLTVSKAPLTITAKSYSIKQGTTVPTFEATYSGFKNNDTESILTKQPTFSCSATSSSSAGTYPITVSGAEAANYSMTYVAGTLTITEKPSQSMSLTSLPSMTYGASNYTLPAKTTQGLSLTWTSSNINVATISGYTLTVKGAGTATITATQAGNSNYKPFSKTFTLTVSKATLTVTANSYTIQEGSALPTYAVSFSGFKNGDTKSVLTKQPTITCSATTTSAPGSYSIKASGATAANYNFSYVNGTLTITEKPSQSMSLASLPSMTYGAANYALPTQTTQGLALTWASSNTSVATISGNTLTVKGAGTATITASQAGNEEYKPFSKEFTLTVAKAPLTITAQDFTRYEGEENPAFTVSYEGFVKNEDATVLTAQPVIATTATVESAAGTYPITVSGATAANYDITFVAGTLTVQAKSTQTIALTSLPDMTYGGDAYTLPAQTEEGFDLTWASSNANVATISGNTLTVKGAGTATITASQSGNEEYKPFSKEFALTVAKAPLTITASDANKNVGEENPAFTASYEGFVGDDDATVLTAQPSFTCEATTESPVGSYDINVSGAEAANYEMTYVKGTLTVVDEWSMNNTLALADTQVLCGRQVVLPVNMSNTEDITAIQFDLTLPAGVSIAKNSKGKYIVTKTERCADHTLTASKPGEANVYKVLMYSTEVESITGNEGAVINVTLEAAENMEAGDYEVRISSINLTTKAEKKISPADVTCVLTVRNSIPGDANGDGVIDVTDIVGIANGILGRPSESFDAVAADVNGDGSVDVTDIVVVANIILHDGGANAANVRGTMMQVLDPQ